MRESKYHEPVMVREVLRALHIKKGHSYIDATIGTGGYAIEIVKRGGYLLGIDLDPEMLEIAQVRLEKACPTSNRKVESLPFKLACGNFKDIDEIAKKEGFDKVEGIIFDLGVSNLHLTGSTRGFSFGNADATLDMRLNPNSQGVKGSDLLNGLREDQLTHLFARVLPFFKAKKIARAVSAFRDKKKFETVGDFLEALKGIKGKPGLNFATLPFLALRMAVGSELENLKEALPKALSLLEKDGKLLVLSFHSKETETIREAKISMPKPIFPTDEEVAKNARARSAKLWILEK